MITVTDSSSPPHYISSVPVSFSPPPPSSPPPMKGNPIASHLKSLVAIAKPRRRTEVFAYGFAFAFLACTVFLAFNHSSNSSSPWLNNLFTSSSSLGKSIAPYKSQVSSIISRLFPNSTGTPLPAGDPGTGEGFSSKDGILGTGSERKVNQSGITGGEVIGSSKGQVLNQTGSGVPIQKEGDASSDKSAVLQKNQTGSGEVKNGEVLEGGKNQTGSGDKKGGVLVAKKNQTASGIPTSGSGDKIDKNVVSAKNQTGSGDLKDGNLKGENQVDSSQTNGAETKNQTENKGVNTPVSSKNGGEQKSKSVDLGVGGGDHKRDKEIENMDGCDIYQGQWVKDDSYPLYQEGSCPHIDEPFDCYLNGRPDHSYQKLRWKPDGCNIPRLNATDMLERMRGKRLVFIGDSLNRNMWESLVCVLRSSLKDKKKVFEASGKHEFRTEGSYSFLFEDYNATVEFFRSPFLVQEWEMPDGNATKETLRLDTIERSSSNYKDAHAIIFNTGHWWTHEKTSKGKDYYQEGNRVYSELNVDEAFHKALNTWARWVDANVNRTKTLVFFRGYSASHFSGGQWNSGGACDRETEPIKNETYLSSYPPMMSVLESVIKGMKTPVSYLNITGMTDYRKDAHPSVYRKQNLSEEERKNPERFQDCSHWCLPGVPDSWNELLYAQLIIKQHQMSQ